MMPRYTALALLVLLMASGSALAQSSASYRLEEYTFNAGGTPTIGVEVSSASLRLTVSSIGNTVFATGVGSPSFVLDSGFGVAYPPPGEVASMCGGGGGCLGFDDKVTLSWPPERSAGSYNLYRDDLSSGYGACVQPALAVNAAMDAAMPAPGSVFYYLVTVENRLAEEGTKGFESGAAERLGATCP